MTSMRHGIHVHAFPIGNPPSQLSMVDDKREKNGRTSDRSDSR